MRILITNDDGVRSPVIPRLIEWAKGLGEVITVAPAEEQSGKSHSIELKRKLQLLPVDLGTGTEVYSLDSTPADCVRVAGLGLGKKFDLVISGINRGYNLGSDIVYSGTVGAIFEASRQGINALALSTVSQTFDPAVAELDRIWGFITENKLFEKNDLYNVNIPAENNGILITRHGGVFYGEDFVKQEDGRYKRVPYVAEKNASDLTTDSGAVLSGYISVTPLTGSRTAEKAYEELAELKA